MDVKTALYRISDGERLLYVGIGAHPTHRLGAHRKRAWWPDRPTIEIQWFASRDEALQAETEVIRDEGPLHNVVKSQRRRAIEAATLPVTLDLVGCAEIASMFGVSRQYVFALSHGGSFPHPVAKLGCGTIWMRADIVKWAKAAGRKPHAA